ncbi:hypothetical protein MMC26_003855 [Xylographa opegraphella]|nr:hypothetical protein [Xylographa opegraphella]
MPFVTVPELLARHEKYVDTYTPAWKFAELNDQSTTPHVLIITCLDPRIEPERMFDLHKGEASVIRNVAGRPEPALTDIIAITTLAPITDIMLLHHSARIPNPKPTDCGATHFTEQSMKQQLRERVPGHDEAIEALYFGEIVGGDLERSVRDDVAFLQHSPFVKQELRLHGYIVDVVTGQLQTVVA